MKKQILQFRSTLIALPFFLIILTACGNQANQQDQLLGKWNLEYANLQTDELDISKDRIKTNKGKQEVFKDNQLVLNADSTFFLVFGKSQKISFGMWSKAGAKISLFPIDTASSNLVFEIEDLKSRKMVLSIDYSKISLDKNRDLIVLKKDKINICNYLEYRRKDNKFLDSAFSTYASVEKNRWRIKPTHPENEAEIKKRVVDALDFTFHYLKYNKELSDHEDTKSVSLLVLKNMPLWFAGNGIQLEQNADWDALFYDEYDAKMSYEILRTAFREIKDLYISDEYKGKPLDLNLFIIENLRDAIV